MTGHPDDIIDRWRQGQRPSDRDLSELAQALSAGRLASTEAYTALRMLGECSPVNYRSIVEQFLTCSSDPMLARRALEVLCHDWDLTEQYLPVLKDCLKGWHWDEDDDCKTVAASAAGEFLRENDDPELLKLLLMIYEDRTECAIMREAAYSAIGRAVGRDWSDLPSAASDSFDIDSDIDQKILELARHKAQAR